MNRGLEDGEGILMEEIASQRSQRWDQASSGGAETTEPPGGSSWPYRPGMGLSAQLKKLVLPSFSEVKGGPIIPGHKVVFRKLGYCEFLSLHRNPQS